VALKNILQVRVPSKLRLAVTRAAGDRLQSESEFVRQALIDKIQVLGFETAAEGISKSDVARRAALRDLAKQSPVAA
jgi:hypothetical protein